MVKKIGLVALLVALVLVIVNFDLILDRFFGTKTINSTEVKVLLREDPNLDELLETLHGKKVIADVEKAKGIAEDMDLDVKNLAGGKYVIAPGTQVKDLLRGFEKDENGRGKKEVLVNVIFNSCRDLNDVAHWVSACIAADSASIYDYFNDPATLSKYGFTRAQMPAMILPQQYEMEFDTDAEEFAAFMAEQFKAFWTDERKQKLAEIGLKSQSQVVTLASIVYSEQGKVKEEWPVIARLYLNRINKGMKLKSDPTFKFCWGHQLDGVQRLTGKHRDIDCEYNTYKIKGLPPGPICVTPAKVVDAVLNPANVDYLFMCAKKDFSGKHDFTASDVQHMKNASAYQNWLSQQN